MKILLVGPASPLRGGIANFNDSLNTELGKKHDTLIIGFSLQYPSMFFPGRTQYDNGASKAGPGAAHLISSINPLSWWSVADEIVRMNPDCLVVQYWMPFFAPALGTIVRQVKKKIKIPVIGLLHNVKPHEGIPVGRLLGRYFFNSCDGFIAMSSAVIDELSGIVTGKPTRLVPHPVYDIFGEPVDRQYACEYLGLDCEQRHLLFFGIIRKYKGLELLIKAMASPRISHLNLKLLVAGEFYENEKRYLDLVEKLGLEDRIMFTRSFVPKEKVSSYFAASDLIVLPYLSATQSGVTQIAFHFDKPMLVTNAGGLGEIVANEKVGYVCEKDPEAIASAIADFFDKKRSDEFVENIRNEKKRFSWERMVEGIEELLEELTK